MSGTLRWFVCVLGAATALLAGCDGSADGLHPYNTPPSIIIRSPADGFTIEQGQAVTFRVTVGDTEDLPTELKVEWASSIDGTLYRTEDASAGTCPDLAGDCTFYRSDLSVGDHLLTVRATDTGFYSAAAQVMLHVKEKSEPPTCDILAPEQDAVFVEGEAVAFTGKVGDPNGDLVSLRTTWASDLDGTLVTSGPDPNGNTGYTAERLSIGRHTITLYVKDPTDLVAYCTRFIEVEAQNRAPSASISAPADGSLYRLGDPIRFAGVISDDRDPAELLSVEWESDIDGILDTQAADNAGNVTFITSELSAALHTITLRVTDAQGLIAEDSRLIEVQAPNQAPTAQIVSITPDIDVLFGTNVVFQGLVTDPEDAAITLSVTWESSLQGTLSGGSQPDGSGNVTLATAALAPGIHTITLRVEDSEGLAHSDSALVTIRTPNNPPTGEILSPAEGTYLQGTPLLFSAKVTDVEDDEKNLVVTWLSDIDGTLPGTPSPDDSGTLSFLYSALSAGTHQITLRVADTGGALASDSMVLTVRPPNVPPEAEFTGPAITTWPFGSTVILTGVVSDAEDDPASLTVAFNSDKDGQLCAVTPDSAGNVYCTAEELRDGTHLMTLSVTDLDGATATATLVITIELENQAPVVELESPVDGEYFIVGEPIPFRATATDKEDGEATLTVEWTSSLDGVFNTTPPDNAGNIVFTDSGRSLGRHEVTLKVTDSKGYYAVKNVVFSVEDVNTPPEALITAPEDGVISVEGTSLSFVGEVLDLQDDPSALSIEWSSDRDGVISTNPANSAGVTQFTTGSLSLGTHTINLTVTDTKGSQFVDSIVVTIRAANQGPQALIDLPIQDSRYTAGDVVTFKGQATDDVTPVTSLGVRWYSDKDGDLNTASPDAQGKMGFTWDGLSVGVHFITLEVTDADGAVSIDAVTVSVDPVNTPPTGEILTPADGLVVVEGTSILFTGQVGDADDNAQDLSVVWSSDAQGALNSAGADASGKTTFSTSGLTVGTHLVTLKVTDTDGAIATDTVTVTVRKAPTAPKVTLISPAAGTYVDGTTLNFKATVSDDVDAPAALAVEWESNVDGVFNSNGADGAGNISFLYAGLSVSSHLITLRVTDSDGLASTQSVTVVIKDVNTPPVATILAPTTGTTFIKGSQIVFKGKVSDVNQAANSLSLSWTSDLDGTLNNAPSDSSGNTTFATGGLSAGTHLITLSVADSDGGVDSETISLTVRESPQPPAVQITSPSASTYVEGTTLTFAGKVSDVEDAENTLTISWASNIDGVFNTTKADAAGNLSFLKSDLSVGTHLISLTVTDSDGLLSTATVTLTIRKPNALPSVAITAPADGLVVFQGEAVTFSATASDAETAKTSLQVRWASDVDGQLSTAAPNSSGVTQFTSAALSVGTHFVTVTVTDADGGVAADSVTVIVRATNSAPTAQITAPTSGNTWFQGSTITFQGKVSDADDAETALAIEWSSNKDGVLSTAGADAAGNVVFATSSLSVGTHTITLKVTDTDGIFSTAVVVVNIRKTNTPPAIQITAPTDGITVAQGSTVSFQASVTDAEDAPTSLTAEWRSDLNGVLNTDPPNISGVLAFSTSSLSVGSHLVTLRVTDVDGAVGTAQVALTVIGPNQPPSISITAPADNQTFFSGTTLTFKADADDVEDPPTALSVEFESDIDGVFASATPDAAGKVAFTNNALSVGTHLITARVTDTDGAVASDAITLKIRLPNANPTAQITAPTNGTSVFQGTTINFTGKVSDAEDLETALTVLWSSNKDGSLGASSPDGSGNVSLTRNNLSVGTHIITLSVTDTEGLSGSATVSLTIRGPNQNPSTQITSPTDGTIYVQGTTISFKGKVSDPEDAANLLTIEWRSSLDGVLNTAAADTGGNVTFASSGLKIGSHLITLKATDLDGASTTASITVVVKAPNVPPSVTITGPSTTTYDFGQSVALTATASDTESAANLLTYIITSNLQGTLASGSVSSAGAISYTTTGLTVGVHTLTVKVTDPDGGVATDDISITVNALNQAPTIDITAPTSGATVNEGTSVLFKATASDAEDLETALTYKFISSIDGQFKTGNPDGAGNISFSISTLSVGTHTITATITDTAGASATDTITLTVVRPNAPPAVNITAPTTFTYEQGTLVTFSATASDAEDAENLLNAKWTSDKDGVLFTSNCNASGVTTFSKSNLTVATHLITVTITDTQGATGSASITVTVIPPNTAPSVDITAPTSGSTVFSGSAVLFKGTATDVQDAETALTYTWTSSINGVFASGSPDAAGNISNSYSSLSVGSHTITLTAVDTGGLSASDTITLIVVAPNAAPTISITKPTTTTFESGQAITFEGMANDAEDAKNTLTVAWSSDKDGTLNVGNPDATGKSTFSKALSAVGVHVITATVTDSQGATGTSTMSITVTTANTPPVVAITAPPNGGVTSSGSLLLFTGTAVDAESAETALTILWTSDKDGTLNTTSPDSSGNVGFSTSSLSLGSHTITLKATDPGGLFATASIALTVKQANRAPNTAPVVQVTPGSPKTADDLVAVVTSPATDPDGDTVSYKYQWYKNSTLQAGLTTDTVSNSVTFKAEVWKVVVTPTDGSLDGPTGEASVTIGNTAPSIASVSISPTSGVTEASTLTVSVSGYSDPDGDAAANIIEWYVGVTKVATGPSSINGTYFNHFDSVTCRVTPSDGSANGTPLTSNAVTIANTAPTAPVVAFTNTDPNINEVLTCQVTTPSSDIDGDPIEYLYEFLQNGVVYNPATQSSNSTSASLSASVPKFGEVWSCRVTPDDGFVNGTSASTSVTILPDAGDLVVTELMINPNAVADSVGEYVEIKNNRSYDIPLDGFTLTDASSDTHTISSGGGLKVLAGKYVVVGRSTDTAVNGGATVNYQYTNFSLTDTNDQVNIKFNARTVDTVTYSSATWPVRAGRSMSLDPASSTAAANDSAANWCAATSFQLTLLDFGTPTVANEACSCAASDGDNDAFGDNSSTCNELDCNDANAAVNPSAVDICENGVDEDCAGGDASCNCTSTDGDGDGYGDGASCNPKDCNDLDPNINPGATEILCNGKDDDCNSATDDSPDVDGDTYDICPTGVAGADSKAVDCNDSRSNVNPGAAEVCDDFDNNCNGTINETFDTDSDLYYTCSVTGKAADCDDTNPARNPGATEICDAYDNDCDSTVNEGFGDTYEGSNGNNTSSTAYAGFSNTDDSTIPVTAANIHASTDIADFYSIAIVDDPPTNTTFGDAFKITVSLSSIPSGTNYDLYLYRQGNGTPIAQSTSAGTTNENVTFNATSSDDSGTYLIEVRRVSGFSCTTYNLNIANSG